MGNFSINQNYGTYAIPTTFGPVDVFGTFQLGQAWFDFSRITQANVQVTVGGEGRILVNSGSPLSVEIMVGVFILPDGDVNAGDLFGLLSPDASAAQGATGAITGFNGTATIANPGIPRQVLFGLLIHSIGSSETFVTGLMRSANANFIGV